MRFSDISWKRYTAFLLLTFVVWFFVSLMLYTLYLTTGSPWVSIVIQLQSPLVILACAWLYFRKAPGNDWLMRVFVAVTWLTGMWLLAAVAMHFVYGTSWTYPFTWDFFKAQGFNFTAMIVAGYLGHSEAPKLKEVNEPLVDEVFRP